MSEKDKNSFWVWLPWSPVLERRREEERRVIFL